MIVSELISAEKPVPAALARKQSYKEIKYITVLVIVVLHGFLNEILIHNTDTVLMINHYESIVLTILKIQASIVTIYISVRLQIADGVIGESI